MIRRYSELDLWVRQHPTGKGFWVEVSYGKRVAQGKFEEPFTREELDAFREVVSKGQGRSIEAKKLARSLGKKLFNAIFVDSLRDLWNRARQETGFTRGLRLRVRPAPEVSHWPWELLHSPRRYLALSTSTPVVRHVGDPETLPSRWLPWPLRILVVIPSPSGCDALDGEKELREIQEALALYIRLRLVHVENLDSPTLDSLEDRLNRERFDVLHFVGHGSFRQDEGVLLFEGLDRARDPVDGESLAGTLNESIRLVVLNACEGACSSPDDPFAGVAQSLVRLGVPAVLAMQYPIEDSIALRFSRQFYNGLAEGRMVDLAVTRARRALRRGLDWTIPILFLSSRSGQIIRFRPPWKWLVAIAVLPLLGLGSWQWYRSLKKVEEGPTPSFVEPCPPVEGLDMKFVRIPAGKFLMGSERDDEKPVHEVVISRPFCLGVYEVTQKQWESIMGLNSVESKHRGDDLPVTSVSWDEVQDFMGKVNQTAGLKIVRLPTEAEWEYAARGLPAAFNCRDDKIGGLAPVRSPRPNHLGLHYMHGNVWEWVQDWYGLYPSRPVTDPQGPASGEKRVKRGGGYDSAAQSCRPTKRNKDEPGNRRYDVGFRVLRELDGGSGADQERRVRDDRRLVTKQP